MYTILVFIYKKIIFIIKERKLQDQTSLHLKFL